MFLGIFFASSASPSSCSLVRCHPGRNHQPYIATAHDTAMNSATLLPILSATDKPASAIHPLRPYRRHTSNAALSTAICVHVRAPNIAQANVNAKTSAAPRDFARLLDMKPTTMAGWLLVSRMLAGVPRPIAFFAKGGDFKPAHAVELSDESPAVPACARSSAIQFLRRVLLP